MQDIRLIALDMDGTVLDDNKQISPRTLAALRAAQVRGVEVVPATGRTVNGVPEAFMALQPRYAIGSNGATVLDLAAGRQLVNLPFTLQQAQEIYRVVQKFDSMISIFIGEECYMPTADSARIDRYTPPNLRQYLRDKRIQVADMAALMTAHPDEIKKFSILYADYPTRDAAWAAVAQQFPQVEITSSVGCNMEINAPGVDKGRGLAELARVLGLDRCQVMACGDSGNDLAMVRFAGLGVAMGNADADVKEAARYVTLDNNHDGVAAAVEKFVLQGGQL